MSEDKMIPVQSKFIQQGKLWINEQYELVENDEWFIIRRKAQ